MSSMIPLTILSLHTDETVMNLSIEFDRDCDYFAIAGVTRKIKVSRELSVIYL
jgi:hypothetical protein